MSTSDAPALICYDRSLGARHAIEYAAALFPGKHAVMLNIWGFPLAMAVYGLGNVAAYSEDSKKKLAAEAADEGCEIADEAGLVARPVVTCGDLNGTWRTILRVADEHDASVVVMGSRSLGSMRALFLGSVSCGVLRHSHRPVLVVPPSAEIETADGIPSVSHQAHGSPVNGPILICYDRSVEARHAIERAAALFPGKRAIILNLWDYPLELPAYGLADSMTGENVQRSLADAATAEGCRIARRAGLDAEPLVECESLEGAWQTIVSIANDHRASVIVLGARGLGEVRSLVFGSISNEVTRHANRPVLVVPTGVESTLEEPRRPAGYPAAHWALSL